MIIHQYNDRYAAQNGVGGSLELIVMLFVGIIGLIVPAILWPLEIIGFFPALIIWIATLFALIIFGKKLSAYMWASMSVLIEYQGDLYYMRITPDLRGSTLPKSASSALAGRNAVYAGNRLAAEREAAQVAHDDQMIKALFNSYIKGEYKRNLDTIMYGPPVRVFRLLEQDFRHKHQKAYRVKCIKGKGRRATVTIPRSYPTFFTEAVI